MQISLLLMQMFAIDIITLAIVMASHSKHANTSTLNDRGGDDDSERGEEENHNDHASNVAAAMTLLLVLDSDVEYTPMPLGGQGQGNANSSFDGDDDVAFASMSCDTGPDDDGCPVHILSSPRSYGF